MATSVASPRPKAASPVKAAPSAKVPAKALQGNPLLRPSADARVVWFRSLATMFAAGINVDRALRLLGEQSDNKAMTEVSVGLAEKVSAGVTLSNGMAMYPNAFSKLQYRLIQMAERAGVMDKVLNELSRYEEKERDIILKMKGAVSYPAFIFAIAFLMLIVVPPYMMEGLFQMIKGSGVQPPLLTRVVMAATGATRSPIFYIILVAAAVAAYMFLPPLLRKPHIRRAVASFILTVPVLGRLYRTVAVSRFTRALGVQLDCGISPLLAIQLAGDASDNPILEETLPLALQALREGETVERALTSTRFFPVLMLKMVQVGEESASLPDLLDRTADLYEAELDNVLETFTALLEPMVMLVMGVIVGILVLATMLPMMQVLQNL